MPCGPTSVTDDGAALRLVGGGQLLLDRKGRTATFRLPEPVTDEELAHPLLGAVGSFFAGWHGRQALHAGAFCANGGTWALVGEKGAGKSSMLAWLARAGFPVVADDILVVDDGRAFAGPRCIDLREEPAAHLELHEARPSRSGERRRLRLGPVQAESTLSGWIFLEWGDRVALETLRPGERLLRLTRYRNGRTSKAPEGVLDLAQLPAWVLRRPRRLEFLPETCGLLLALAGL